MILKWALAIFAIAALALFAVTKLITFLNPPRPGRPEPRLLVSTRRALRWSVLVPALVGLVILALTVFGGG